MSAAASGDAPPAPRLGVLIPCRDEAAVLPRKLANLARTTWPAPPTEGPHRLVVVDDGSEDDTAAVARGFDWPLDQVELSVVENRGRPGKAGAIARGLAELEGCDLVILTDADVVLRPAALGALAASFAAEPGLAMASGAQEFVCSLADDGTCRGADGAEPVPAGGLYDRWTAWVRRLESRSGRLFSVHGQLLAWRAGLGLAPTPGLAADDLDLRLQARGTGGTVRLVEGARFLERKTPAGAGRDGQAMRRARAYFQVLRRSRAPRGAVDRLQWCAYRFLPGLAPWLALVTLILAGLGLGWAFGASGLAAGLAGAGLVLALPVGRRLVWLLDVILRAWWRERRGTLPDRWEMERT